MLYTVGECYCGKPCLVTGSGVHRCKACRDEIRKEDKTKLKEGHCRKCGAYKFLLGLYSPDKRCGECRLTDMIAEGATVYYNEKARKIVVDAALDQRIVFSDSTEEPDEEPSQEMDRFSHLTRDEGPFYIVNEKNEFYGGTDRWVGKPEAEDYELPLSFDSWSKPRENVRWHSAEYSEYAPCWDDRKAAFRVLKRLRQRTSLRVAIVPLSDDEETREKERDDRHDPVANPPGNRSYKAFDLADEGVQADAPRPSRGEAGLLDQKPA